MAKGTKNKAMTPVKTKYRTRTVEIARKVTRRARKVAGEEVHTLSAVGSSVLLGAMESRNVQLPHIPFLGVAGTYGLILWFLGRQMKNKLIQHLGTGLLSVQGYRLGFQQLGPGKMVPVVTNTATNQTATMPEVYPWKAPDAAVKGADYLNPGSIPDRSAVLGALRDALSSLSDEEMTSLFGDDDDVSGDDDDVSGDDDDVSGLSDDDLAGIYDDEMSGDDDDVSGDDDDVSGDDEPE